MTESRADFEPDIDLFGAMNTPGVEAPQGFHFSEEAGDNLINQTDIEGFDPRYQNDVEGLLWLGFLNDSFVLFGHHFVIKTLTRGERLAVTLLARQWEDTLGLGMAYEAFTVAAAVQAIDGEPLNPQLGPNVNPQVRIEKNYETVSGWYEPLLEAIYGKYSQLMVRQVAAFTELQSK